MSGIILYQSKYGATKKYAEWLSEETGFKCVETKKAKIEEVKTYDTIVLGGGIYAGGIAGIAFLRKHIKDLQGKKIVVFTDGASPYEEKFFNQLVAQNLKDELAGIPCFYCRGAYDLEGMRLGDKMLCKMLINSVSKKKPEELEVWEQALLEGRDKKCDWTDRSNLAPIIEAVK